MDKETFDGAVETARAIIRKTEKAHAHFGATPAEGFAHFYKIRPEETREAYLRDMIWCSEEIKAAWDAVNLIAQDLLGEGKPLPPETG